MFMQGKSIVRFENEVFLYLAIDLSDQGDVAVHQTAVPPGRAKTTCM